MLISGTGSLHTKTASYMADLTHAVLYLVCTYSASFSVDCVRLY